MSLNLDRRIANLALTLVSPLHESKGSDNEAEYRALEEGFPIMLRSAGLLQAVSFLKAKRAHPHGTLYNHLTEQFRGLEMLKDKQELGVLLSDPKLVPMREYRLYCQMADRIGYWHKRMAQAYLETRSKA